MNYLERLLTTTNQNDDSVLYGNALNEHKKLGGKIDSLNKEIEKIIEYGNITDKLETGVEDLRVANEHFFKSLKFLICLIGKSMLMLFGSN